MSGLTQDSLAALYLGLLRAHGPQHWWPTQDDDNPRFEVIVGAVLTQHTAWANAESAIETLRQACPLTPQALLTCDNLSELIRQAGTHRVKAERLRALCHWFVEAGGFAAIEQMNTTALRRNLRAVHGIGPETADVIALYAFDRPAFIADAYAFRLFERCGLWQGAYRYERLCQAVEGVTDLTISQLQDLHALIVAHAKVYCIKRNPACGHCPLIEDCHYGKRRRCFSDLDIT